MDSPRHGRSAREIRRDMCACKTRHAVAGENDSGSERSEVRFRESGQMAAAGSSSADRSCIPPRSSLLTQGLRADVSIGPYVVIEQGSRIGAGTVIEAFCFLGRGSRLGEDCRLHPRVTIYAGSGLGNRVELHSGVVIGGDGFGYVFGEGRHLEISADRDRRDWRRCRDRRATPRLIVVSLETTDIGNGVKIDNLVQIAHNVQIGEHSVLAAQTGISGSSTLGKHVLVGGQVGIGDHAHVEDGAIVGGQAGILPGKIVRHGQTVWGTPARPLDKFKEQHAWFARLPELAERIRRLEEGKPSR